MANQSNNKKSVNEVNQQISKSNSFKTKALKSVQKSSIRSTSQTRLSHPTTHPTTAFIEKAEKEFNRLETKITDEFRRQLSDLFENANFADTFIIRGKFQKKVHSCLLKTRVPLLFTQLLTLNLNRNAFNCQTNQYSVKIPPEIKENELKVLLQKIYSDFSSDIMEKEENFLTSKIEILNKSFIVDHDQDQMISEQNIDITLESSKMESSVEYVTHSDEELEEYDDREENCLGVKTQMIRSGTFELLTSIYSDDNYDLKKSKEAEESQQMKNEVKNDETEQKQCEDRVQSNDKMLPSIDDSNKTSDSMSNSMFSMFIEINEIPNEKTENQRPKSERDSRKGFDFIPLNSKTSEPKKPIANQRKIRNSADAVLVRSIDSFLPKIKPELEDDIPLLPMSPIVRKKPEEDFKRVLEKRDVRDVPKNQKLSDLVVEEIEGQCSSSDSFSEAFNECMNISVRSSSKNSYESDSIGILNENECKKFDNFIDDSDNESMISGDGNDNSDIDFNDSQTIRNMKSCSKLGEDLLKMFVQQINSDIIIKVSDREIRAHKCILTARCRYFEAMLSGNWIESDSNYVDLQGFSYNSVYFALCHIYSGCLTLPSKMDLSELALLSDILAMDSLKEIVVHELLVNRCHFFHQPCSDNCIVSIIKCMKLCSRSGLNDLYKRCLNWSAKYFNKVWNNKSFASLKPPLLEACLQIKVNQLLPENVLKTTLECERMITSIPRVKWAEPVFTLLARLIEQTCDFISANYNTVITSKDFLALGRGNSWDISNLEQTLLAAMTKLTPDVSCKALIELNKILLLQENEQNDDGFSYGPFNDKFGQLVTKMQRYCERFMIQNANRVVHCQSWTLLSNESQQKVRDGAVIVFEFDKPVAAPPKFMSRVKKIADSSKGDNSGYSSSSSKGAVPKNRSRTITSSRKAVNGRSASDQHIYDSVPFEDNIASNKTKATESKRSEINRKEKVSNRALSLHLNSRRTKEKVAKVSPFSVKTQNFCDQSDDSYAVKDLVAEIDAESNLVTHCLQEAELLELELTKKFNKTQNKRSSVTENTSSVSQPIDSKSIGSHPKESLRKVTSRPQSTSSPIKSRLLPRVAKTKENSRK